MHHMTTGAGNDIERATDMARKMVCEWGMSELGPLSFGKKEEQIFLGREIAQHRDYSEETAIRIDEQVKKLVQGGYDTAAEIIEEHSDALVKIAETLLEREILDGNEVLQIIKGDDSAAACTATAPKDSDDDTQQVLRPEAGPPFARTLRRRAAAAGVIPRFPVYLFDIDGTLLDSAQRYLRRDPAVLDRQRARGRDVTFDYLKSFIGLHLIDLFQDVFPAFHAAQIDGLIQQYRSNYLARGHPQDQAVSRRAKEALAALGGRKSTATTKGTPTTRAVLEQFGLIQYFDHVQGTDGFPCKPAPDVLLAAMAALGASPEDCLFVGDSPATWTPAARRREDLRGAVWLRQARGVGAPRSGLLGRRPARAGRVMPATRKPEIMSPAGYWPQLRAAIEAGADAVYFGLKHFTARAKVGFALEELPEAMRTLHRRGVKGYVTFNTLVFDHELEEAARALAAIAEAGADAIIVQDLGAVKLARRDRARPRNPRQHADEHHQRRWRALRAEPGREPRRDGARAVARRGPRHSRRRPIASWKCSSTARCACPTPASAFRRKPGAAAAPIADSARRPAGCPTN